MKALEVAKIELKAYGLSNEDIIYQLQKKGIDPNMKVEDIDEFTQSKSFELIKADLILSYTLTEVEKWQQGDRSESRNFDALKDYVSAIYRKYGLTDPFVDQSNRPTVRRIC